ncbi:hypothetical protein, partial [Streptococcus pneumoniae]|uniref:hypothetical protein n=1 Tax=Streptococcus pneumoniae TaxID=1313 RepID=UPI001E5FCC00
FWNVMKGAAVGGAIGGVLSAAGASWKVAKAGVAAENELAFYSIIDGAGKNASSDAKLVNYFQQLDYTPAPLNDGPLALRSAE